jgi:hypothetical protein
MSEDAWAELVNEVHAELSSPKSSRPMMIVGGKDLRNICTMADEIERLRKLYDTECVCHASTVEQWNNALTELGRLREENARLKADYGKLLHDLNTISTVRP